MIFNRHTPVIADKIKATFLNLPRGKIPMAWITDIGFVDRFPIYKKLPIPKFDAFPLQRYDAFQKCHFVSCETDYHHIMPFGFRKKISQSPTKVDTSIGVGWLHTDPLNSKRNAEITEKKIGEERDQKDPDQEGGC